jgi:cell fate (sporulation/competence/biofilm development) regulator YlbF (YheA/YmcA/DUF963 family)
MQILAEDSAVMQKTMELCQTLLDQPEMQSLRQQIDTFLADEAAQNQYQTLVEKSQELQQRQESSVPLSREEIADFESQRQALIDNPVARGFLDAQQGFNHIKETVTRYVSRTFELGRVPGPDDFEKCGHGCSCGH